jgi:hypothetical protein
MVIATTQCIAYRHPEFVLEADEALVPIVYLRKIADTIEQMVAGGSIFKVDQTFRVGWMMTLVRSHGDGNRLTLAEPDMQTTPIRWVDGITQTLRQMMLQLFMLDSVGLRDEIDLPTIQHSLIACAHYRDADFYMERGEATPAVDTGWFVGCTRGDHDHNAPANLHCISLYEAYLHQRGILAFAAFPVGSQILVTRERGPVISRHGKHIEIVAGSFLDDWFKKGGLGLPPEVR